jgi:hypothetical protein
VDLIWSVCLGIGACAAAGVAWINRRERLITRELEREINELRDRIEANERKRAASVCID